jgi:hypothetical protein
MQFDANTSAIHFYSQMQFTSNVTAYLAQARSRVFASPGGELRGAEQYVGGKTLAGSLLPRCCFRLRQQLLCGHIDSDELEIASLLKLLLEEGQSSLHVRRIVLTFCTRSIPV